MARYFTVALVVSVGAALVLISASMRWRSSAMERASTIDVGNTWLIQDDTWAPDYPRSGGGEDVLPPVVHAGDEILSISKTDIRPQFSLGALVLPKVKWSASKALLLHLNAAVCSRDRDATARSFEITFHIILDEWHIATYTGTQSIRRSPAIASWNPFARAGSEQLLRPGWVVVDLTDAAERLMSESAHGLTIEINNADMFHASCSFRSAESAEPMYIEVRESVANLWLPALLVEPLGVVSQ